MADTDLALNLSDIRYRLIKRCREEPYENGDGIWVCRRWNTAQDIADMTNIIHDAVKIYCNKTRMLKAHRIIRLYENIFQYDMPENMFRVRRVWFSDFSGWCLIHSHTRIYCSSGQTFDVQGSPAEYLRDIIPRNKIWILPVPNTDGSSFEYDGGVIFGLLRAIQDELGNYMPFDANYALRRIAGCYFEAIGDGRIIRGLIPHTGNLRIDYERYPNKMTAETHYPDLDSGEIPEHEHQHIPWLAAALWLEDNGETPEDYQLAQRRMLQANAQIQDAATEPLREIFKQGMVPG